MCLVFLMMLIIRATPCGIYKKWHEFHDVPVSNNSVSKVLGAAVPCSFFSWSVSAEVAAFCMIVPRTA